MVNRQLLDAIYDAPFSENGWRIALSQIADRFGSTDAAIYTSCENGETLTKAISGRLGEEVHQEYFDEYMARDTQIVRLLRLNEDRDITGLELFDETASAPCPVHNEYLIPHDISSQIVWLLNGPGRQKYTFALMRSDRFGSFERADRESFGWVAQHVKRAIKVDNELVRAFQKSNQSDFLFSQGKIGVFSISTAGEIICKNAFAEQLLKKSAKLRDAVSRVLRTSFAPNNSEYETPIQTSSVFDVSQKQHFEITLHVPAKAKNSPSNDSGRSHGLCMVQAAPIAGRHKKEFWKERFDLTDAETDLAMNLYLGRSLVDFASKRDRSIHTVRNQMKSLLGKTNCHRQGQLTALLHGFEPE